MSIFKIFMLNFRFRQTYILFWIKILFTTHFCTVVMQQDFLPEEGILFLPIATVCSKLNFPPAPEAERNRQCGPAGWSAEAVFWQSYCFGLWCVLATSSDNAKRSVNFAPPIMWVIASFVALLAGWSLTDAFSWGYQLCAELVPSRARRPCPPLWRSI